MILGLKRYPQAITRRAHPCSLRLGLRTAAAAAAAATRQPQQQHLRRRICLRSPHVKKSGCSLKCLRTHTHTHTRREIQSIHCVRISRAIDPALTQTLSISSFFSVSSQVRLSLSPSLPLSLSSSLSLHVSVLSLLGFLHVFVRVRARAFLSLVQTPCTSFLP